MLFHTPQFLVFFLIVYSLYLVLPHRWQNYLLLVASYVFYGAWEWRYLSLIFLSTVTDYFCGLNIESHEDKKGKKVYLYISILVNLTLLGVFKYYDFFAANFGNLMGSFGIEVQPYFLNVALPIGISFYTFQTISYSVDVYRGRLKACRNFLDFALYVSFFPQLVAGPIERGVRLLPQILKPRKLSKDQILEGCYFILWGLFLKVVIADNMADIVDPVFSVGSENGAMIVLSIYAFAIQIFCDFCGYSLMAIGLAKMMGITLMENFRRPYFTKNISDFWRRWHISLSSWFRDYVFSPYYIYLQQVSFIKKRPLMVRHGIAFFATLFVTEFMLGLWHGAGWNYAFFGVYHALLIWVYYYTKKYWDKMPGLMQIVLTFQIACLGWLIFRSSSMLQVQQLFTGIFGSWSLADPHFLAEAKKFVLLLLPLLLHEIFAEVKNKQNSIMLLPKYVQFPVYGGIIFAMLIFGQFVEKKFIYFQF